MARRGPLRAGAALARLRQQAATGVAVAGHIVVAVAAAGTVRLCEVGIGIGRRIIVAQRTEAVSELLDDGGVGVADVAGQQLSAGVARPARVISAQLGYVGPAAWQCQLKRNERDRGHNRHLEFVFDV